MRANLFCADSEEKERDKAAFRARTKDVFRLGGDFVLMDLFVERIVDALSEGR